MLLQRHGDWNEAIELIICPNSGYPMDLMITRIGSIFGIKQQSEF